MELFILKAVSLAITVIIAFIGIITVIGLIAWFLSLSQKWFFRVLRDAIILGLLCIFLLPELNISGSVYQVVILVLAVVALTLYSMLVHIRKHQYLFWKGDRGKKMTEDECEQKMNRVGYDRAWEVDGSRNMTEYECRLNMAAYASGVYRDSFIYFHRLLPAVRGTINPAQAAILNRYFNGDDTKKWSDPLNAKIADRERRIVELEKEKAELVVPTITILDKE